MTYEPINSCCNDLHGKIHDEPIDRQTEISGCRVAFVLLLFQLKFPLSNLLDNAEAL